ncbi:MAG: septal ring lytic transglycosylase RlpA family protein [Erythrobacter sp.]|nr:septal ring lytic transglycosylase RlpA family protein [Erythrobacter sp.]
MDGTNPKRAVRRWLLPLSALALIGLTAAGRAEEQTAPEAEQAVTAAPLPVFAPSQDALLTPEPAVVEQAEPESEATSLGQGVASYYASQFQGRRTASGESFDNADFTAAHRTLPFGSRVRVTNPRTGESVVVRINDRGPFVRGRTIDLSRAAAEEVGIVRAGHGTVELELLSA